MRVVLVNGEQTDESGLAHLLKASGVECVSRRISAACLHTDQHVVWRGDAIPENPAHLVDKLLGRSFDLSPG